jgi:hypothetical protein
VRLPPDILKALDLWKPRGWSRSDFIRDILAGHLNRRIPQLRWSAEFRKDETAAKITGKGPFTAEKEKAFTEAIQGRMLFEGACDLPWRDYWSFREKHQCATLSSSDTEYAAAYSSCAVPRR